ncbi:uncharacterized protein LOC134534630 [Bacillus rossius redtenbacheri]|uniref:uncharacterized protein LOC134534630 n=1 Tax=Bacillus rossius redtenbacheri TaxID=93214 RepID=UPI002FDE4AC3
MPGNLFSVCVPTADFERQLASGIPATLPPPDMFGVPAAAQARRRPPPIPVTVRPRAPPPLPGEPVPMEKILDELLKKLGIEHSVWCNDRNGNYFQVFFPVGAGDPCENCIHCLTELGIGKKYNSVVSVVPCSVFFQGYDDDAKDPFAEEDPAEKKAWNNFVQSIRSKLTVKQVVDGVRNGAECSFDYLTLVLTADMVAAVGLVENNSVNIVAAMLISPLMGPIMAVTFGTIISDRKLQKIGLRSEFIGLMISLVFGYIFGCLVGCTEDPWGNGDWPTEEMKGRGQARSLWIGILWALPSGTGVALALLQGSAGPLIGVAISASLLPPAVNCGMMWGLATIVHIYPDYKLPYVKGEPLNATSSFKMMYSDHLPNELAAMGIISFCLTLVNICCIFITAIVVLKIKEVAAPYTSSPDLRRFWEYDIRVARDDNRSTLQGVGGRTSKAMMQELRQIPPEDLGETLEAAVREAVDDDTFRKVKRCSYAHNSTDVLHTLGLGAGPSKPAGPEAVLAPLADPSALDQVIQALMGFQKQQQAALQRKPSSRLSRLHPLSRSTRQGSTRSARHGSTRSARNSWLPHLADIKGEDNQGGEPQSTIGSESNQQALGLPTILETSAGGSQPQTPTEPRPRSVTERLLSAVTGQNHRRSRGDLMETISLTHDQA